MCCNTLLSQFCFKHKFTFINIWNDVITNIRKFVSSDGVHLTGLGKDCLLNALLGSHAFKSKFQGN